MYFLSNVRTFCIKSFTDSVSFGTDCENSRTQGCPSLPNLQFFLHCSKAFDPLPPFVLDIWYIFDGLGDTLHCSKIGQYKA